MNRFTVFILSFMALLLFVAPSASALTPPLIRDRLPLIRLYNPTINDHFYTSDWSEAYRAEMMHGYRQESTMGYVDKTQKTGTLGLIRMWNASTKKHFYTTSNDEAIRAVGSGFVREGVIGYILQDLAPGADYAERPTYVGDTAVYRLYNNALRKHFYTVSRDEMLLVQNMGYRLEGNLGNLYSNDVAAQQCPDEWHINLMPGTVGVGDSIPREYFIDNGERREISEYDLDWVMINCVLERQESY
jgi:hypothetical protein